MVGQSRIHFDEVEGVGRFVEIEHVHRNADTSGSGVIAVEELMNILDIHKEDLIACSYADLVLMKEGK